MMFFGGGMFFFWLVVIVAILAAVGGFRGLTAGSRQGNTASALPPETPEEILQRRYASGEMSREEYLEAKNTLQA